MNYTHTILYLSELSYSVGLISIDELYERIEVVRWIQDAGGTPDPRYAHPSGSDELPGDECSHDAEDVDAPEPLREIRQSEIESPDWLHLLFDGKWYFTIADPDSYPAVPHGHLRSPSRAWPKLNPYTGRAFAAKHREDTSLRLSKAKMRLLWRDQRFRAFCRNHILWYMEQHPHFTFPVAYPLRLPRW